VGPTKKTVGVLAGRPHPRFKGVHTIDHTAPTPDSATSPQFDDASPNHRRHIDDHSPKDLPLFDAARAAQARDAAIEAVGRGAPPEVREVLADAIRRVAHDRRTLTTDDVWARVPTEYRESADPRVIGAAMVAAAREGIIERLPGVFLASDMVRCHRRPKQVWRSTTWRAAQ
jgi:hypothetical protein